MSDTTLHKAEPDLPDSVLAAEYVLHLLSPADRRAVEGRLATSGALRAAVVRWQEDFARLADTIREVPPPVRLRARLVTFVRAEPESASRRRARPRRLSAARLLIGMLSGFTAAAVALVLLSVVLPSAAPPPGRAVYTAAIAGEENPFLVEARYDPDAGALFLERSSGAAGEGRVLQLWLLPEGATAPVSLGVLPATRTVRLDLAEDLGAAIPNGLLEVSEEPEGGSPEAGPTGPVLGTGRVRGP